MGTAAFSLLQLCKGTLMAHMIVICRSEVTVYLYTQVWEVPLTVRHQAFSDLHVAVQAETLLFDSGCSIAIAGHSLPPETCSVIDHQNRIGQTPIIKCSWLPTAPILM